MRLKVCFFMGYGTLFNHDTGELQRDVYGSELALYNLCLELKKSCDIYITSLSRQSDKDFGSMHYINSEHLTKQTYRFDVMVVWRYAHYFLLFSSKQIATKTVLWLHDTCALPWFDFKEIPSQAVPLIMNTLPNIDKVITLTKYHTELIMKYYNINDDNKISILGNAIRPFTPSSNLQRHTNRFIWTSSFVRGLKELVAFFPIIRKYLPDAELYVIRKPDPGTDTSFLNKSYIHCLGFMTNEQVQEEMHKADYWFYPTNFEETYCISALEAQRAGCVCIASDLAALTEIIGDRGILLYKPIYSVEYWKEALHAIRILNKNSELKNAYREKAKIWAEQQTWNARAKEWVQAILK